MSVPAYLYPCIAPDSSGLSVYLVGVPAGADGRLEVYNVKLSNIDLPTIILVADHTDVIYWSATAPKACLFYAGYSDSSNSPVFVQQFGTKSFITNVYPNGTVGSPASFQDKAFISPKLFSWTGSVNNLNWVTGVVNSTDSSTKSPWTGVRFSAASIVDSVHEFAVSMYPTSDALLSVGSYSPSSNAPAQGYNIVFDNTGGGVIYTALGTTSPTAAPGDHIVTLSNAQPVDMGGIKLTTNAVSLTMTNVAYILDKASDGSTLMYTISPSKSNKLGRIYAEGNVPKFPDYIATTAMGSQVVIYGSSQSGTAIFNSFDTIAGIWTGPNLMKPSDSKPPEPPSSEAPIGAIVGGVIGGLALIALVAFLFIRNRRKRSGKMDLDTKPTKAQTPQNAFQDPSIMYSPVPMVEQSYLEQQPFIQNQTVQQQQKSQPRPQPQHQQPPHQGTYDLPQQDVYTSQSLNPVQNQAAVPIIFQPCPPRHPQEHYPYTPPTLIPITATQQPTIFQHQTTGTSPTQVYQADYISPSSDAMPETS
ncbi:hypothetical protein BG011_007182 [Mortierella polycephala]|uniref:Transmembrane protein n=1 Tax=Mortierella polycephala TaxID=41804 RepID=A0A9P6PTE8_9FUNG|nr:hypothetical protein BG011_007182 [Mortierella polycephala]